MTYNFSEAMIQSRKMIFLTMVVLMTGIILFAFAWIFPTFLRREGSLHVFLITVVSVVLSVWLTLFLTWKFSVKNLRSRKIEMTPDLMMFISNSPTFMVPFSSITK